MKALKQGINEMKFDAVFFDWGGTLFNPHPSNPCSDPTPQEVMAKGVERATALLNLFGRDVELEEMRTQLETISSSEGLADFEFNDFRDLLSYIKGE